MDGHHAVAWVDVSCSLLGVLDPQSASRTGLRRDYTPVSEGAPERRCSLRRSHCLLVGVFFALGLVALVGSFGAHCPLGVIVFNPVGYSEADTVESLSENIYIQSHQSGKCLDWSDQIVVAADCDTSKEKQKWIYVNQKLEVPFGRCLDEGGDAVHVWPCAIGALYADNQHWRFDPPTGLLQDGGLLESHCLQLDTPNSPVASSVSMQPCDEDNEQQKWAFNNARPLVLTVPPTTSTTRVTAPKTSTASSTAPWTIPWQTTIKTTTVVTAFLPVSMPATTPWTIPLQTTSKTTTVVTAFLPVFMPAPAAVEATTLSGTMTRQKTTNTVRESTGVAKGSNSSTSASAALGSTSTKRRTSAGRAESTATSRSTLPTTEATVPVLDGSTTGEKALPTTTEEQTMTLMPTTTLPSSVASGTVVTTTNTTTTRKTIRLSASGNRAWQITKNGGCLLAGHATAYMGPCNGTKESSTWTQTATGLLLSKEEKCLDDSDGHLLLRLCHVENDGQRWSLLGEHNSSSATNNTNIAGIQSGKEDCMASHWSNEPESTIRVTLEPCNQGATQEWQIVHTELPLKEHELANTNVLLGFLMAVAITAFVSVFFFWVVPRCKACGEQSKAKKDQHYSTLDESARSLPLSQEPALVPSSELSLQLSLQHSELDGLQLHPKPRQVLFADPRPNAKQEIGICCFSERQTQGHYNVLDSMCGCGFLGNSFGAVLELDVNEKAMTFTNAEAAFQALRFSTNADHFKNLSGEEAFQLARDFSGRGFEDPEHGGHGTDWKAMFAVLRAKFSVNTPLGNALEKTGDDFLLCHSSDHDPNALWSNGAAGQGTNWLGMQLMLIRSSRTGWKRWATFIHSQVDTLTGQPRCSCNDNHLQDAVKRASEALNILLSCLEALPSIAQQPAPIAEASADTVSGPADEADVIVEFSDSWANQHGGRVCVRVVLASTTELKEPKIDYDEQFENLSPNAKGAWSRVKPKEETVSVDGLQVLQMVQDNLLARTLPDGRVDEEGLVVREKLEDILIGAGEGLCKKAAHYEAQGVWTEAVTASFKSHHLRYWFYDQGMEC